MPKKVGLDSPAALGMIVRARHGATKVADSLHELSQSMLDDELPVTRTRRGAWLLAEQAIEELEGCVSTLRRFQNDVLDERVSQ